MDVVLNFLFPGDVIRLKVPELLRKEFNLNLIEEYIITGILYKEDSKEYFIDMASFIDTDVINIAGTDIIKIYSLTINIVSFSIDISAAEFNFSEFKYNPCIQSTVSGIEIIKRGHVFYDNYHYCSICSLRDNGVCLGMDKSCEFFNDPKTNKRHLLLGDKIKQYRKNNFIYGDGNDANVLYCSVIGLRFNFNKKISEEEVIVTVKAESNKAVYDILPDSSIEVLSQNSKIISYDQCNLCILKNCSLCNINLLKNLNIMASNGSIK